MIDCVSDVNFKYHESYDVICKIGFYTKITLWASFVNVVIDTVTFNGNNTLLSPSPPTHNLTPPSNRKNWPASGTMSAVNDFDTTQMVLLDASWEKGSATTETDIDGKSKAVLDDPGDFQSQGQSLAFLKLTPISPKT